MYIRGTSSIRSLTPYTQDLSLPLHPFCRSIEHACGVLCCGSKRQGCLSNSVGQFALLCDEVSHALPLSDEFCRDIMLCRFALI